MMYVGVLGGVRYAWPLPSSSETPFLVLRSGGEGLKGTKRASAGERAAVADVVPWWPLGEGDRGST